MEKIFKKGEWTRNRNVPHLVSKVERVLKEGDDTYLYLENDMEIESSLVEAWKPIKGEYCWFWDERENLQLRKFQDTLNGRWRPYGAAMGFKHIEPFLGVLPSVVEDVDGGFQ